MAQIKKKVVLKKVDGEHRILDTKLAGMLGYKKKNNIRKIIKNNLTELERFGGCSAEEHVTNGNKTLAYYLNEKQALYLCTKSTTSNAVDVTIQMVDVFYEYKNASQPSRPQLEEEYTRRVIACQRDLDVMHKLRYCYLAHGSYMDVLFYRISNHRDNPVAKEFGAMLESALQNLKEIDHLTAYFISGV